MPELRRLSRQARLNISQAFAICQLSERHGPVLLGARKCLHRMVTMITRDNTRERAPGQAIHQLREQRLSGVHRRALPGKGSRKLPPTSNRHHQKSPKDCYMSDTGVDPVWWTPED